MSETTKPPPRTPHFDTTTPTLTSVLDDQHKEYEDCLPCRIMGSTALTGLGAYTYYSGRKQLQERRAEIMRSGSRFGIAARKASLVGMSALLVGMGAFRMVN